MDIGNAKLLPADHVRARYGGISLMTLHRWMKAETGFPQPLKIGTRNFWRVSDLEAFDASLVSKAGRAPGKAGRAPGKAA